ncbi:MAG: undecaprenyl-diphosphate phosphatase [bacterium]|nr:undecaprenyl-diphosphate phosphatase [bacterium]
MTIFQAIILGIVQGVTEFLPISSQAHLYLVPYFFGWDYQGLNFDIALHGGTLLAVLLVFGKDYLNILKELIRPLPNPPHAWGGSRRMAWYLVLGSIPAAVVGFLLQKHAETTFRNPLIMVFTLAGFGLLLWVADKTSPSPQSSPLKGEEERLDWKKVLGIGAAQAIAIVPGVSRSGVTMTAGLFSGLNRQRAARFSFLLSGPIIFGVFLFTLPDLVSVNTQLLAGFFASAISGAVAIKFLLNYLTRKGFGLFVWYRLVLAGIILVKFLI